MISTTTSTMILRMILLVNESPSLGLLYQQALDENMQDVAIIHAQAHPLLSQLKQQCHRLHVQQHFKPDIHDLLRLGLESTTLQGQFEHILLYPSKDKVQSLGWMASAFTHLKDGGKLSIACANTHGAKSYESALKKLVSPVYASSKAKCRVFSARKNDTLDVELQQTWLQASLPKISENHGLWAQAGMFSWKKADMGSTLLLQHLPKTLVGKGMDLCCGYGLLSAAILSSKPKLKAFHLVEADAFALACAQRNTEHADVMTYHHVDANTASLPKHMDWVVCNPPFHRGHTRDVALGQNIVSRACGALKRGGELYLVANRQLAYEKILQTQLSVVETLAVGHGFKVIYGQR
ncbi:MAG: methyltransferase [Mariprofundaceae bacterium]|nr:methyltransferase [Mariprofundaceae bacterium]